MANSLDEIYGYVQPTEVAPPPAPVEQAAAPVSNNSLDEVYGGAPAPQESAPAPASEPAPQGGGGSTAMYQQFTSSGDTTLSPDGSPQPYNTYNEGHNPIVDAAYAVGDKVGDVIEAVGGPEARKNASGFAPPVEEVAEAVGIQDKALTAADYWDRPQQAQQTRLGQAVRDGSLQERQQRNQEPKSFGDYLGGMADDLGRYVAHPEDVLFDVGADYAAQDDNFFGDEGFVDWYEANADKYTSLDDKELYSQYLTDIGSTWEEGGLVGFGKGLLNQAIIDPTAVPSFILSGGTSAVAKGAAKQGMTGVARGVTKADNVIQTLTGGPEDVLLEKGAGVVGRTVGKAVPESVKSIFRPSEATERNMLTQGVQETLQSTAATRSEAIDAGTIQQPNPVSQRSGTINTPLPTRAPSAGVPVGGRGTPPSAVSTPYNRSWTLDPQGNWLVDGNAPTPADLRAARQAHERTSPAERSGFDQADLSNPTPQTNHGRMRAALTGGMNGKTPYLANDVPRRRQLIQLRQALATGDQALIKQVRQRNAAGSRFIETTRNQINNFGQAEVEYQLRRLMQDLYRTRNTADPQIWFDNQRMAIADAIERSNYNSPVDLGVSHRKLNGQWVTGPPIIANRGKPGPVLKIEDFDPDPSLKSVIAGVPNPIPPINVRPAGAPVTPGVGRATPAQAGAVPAVAGQGTPQVAINRGLLSVFRSTPAPKIDNPLTEFGGLPIAEGHIPVLRLNVEGTGKNLFGVLEDSMDEVSTIRGMVQGTHPHDPALYDQLNAEYTRAWHELYGKEAPPPDWGSMGQFEANRFAADYATKRWVDSLPALKKKSAGPIIDKILQVSRGVGEMRSATGLYNWAVIPRQFMTQYTGNIFTIMMHQPRAITKMFDPRTWNAFRKHALQSRRGINGPTQGAQTKLNRAIEEMGLGVNFMISDPGRNIAGQIGESALGPVGRSIKKMVASDWGRDMVSMPDNLFRDGISEVNLLPEMRAMQKSFSKEAARIAHDWNTKKNVNVPASEVKKAVEQALKAHHNNEFGLSTISAPKLEKAIKDHFAGRANGTDFDNMANRIARDYRTKQNNIYQFAAGETKKLAFGWDNTRADDALKHIFLYHYWASRAGGLYTRTLLQNPWMAANFARAAIAAHEEAEENDYPAWMQGFTKLLSSPGGSILFANPFSMFGTMLTFADWQHGMDPERLGEDLTMLGRARGVLPFLVNPLWDSAAWALGLYGGEDARPVINPTGFEAIPRTVAQLINLANVNGHLPEGMLRDPNGNPVLLSERPLTEMVAKFSSALGATVREDAQPIPNLYASQQAAVRANLIYLTVENHPEWDSNQVMHHVNNTLNAAEAGNYSDEYAGAERMTMAQQLQGPELEWMPEPMRGVIGGIIRNASPMQLQMRPEAQMALRANPVTALRDPMQLPEMTDEYARGSLQSTMYDTSAQRNLDIALDDYYGDPKLQEAQSKFYDVLNAKNPDGEIINNVHYSQEQIMAMTDKRRGKLAEEALAEAGFGRNDMEAHKDMQLALQESNPDLMGFLGFKDAINNAEDRNAFIDELYANEPGFKRAMDQSPYPKGSEDWYSKAADWTSTYMGLAGKESSLYDPASGIPPASPLVGEFTTAREQKLAEDDGNTFIAERERSVNEAILAQRLLDEAYPGYGYRVGSGNLPSDVWSNMKTIWADNEIDTKYITKSSHYGVQYIDWLAANPNAEDTSYQGYMDAVFGDYDDGSNKFAGMTPDMINQPPAGEVTSKGETTPFTLDGPINTDALFETFQVRPNTTDSRSIAIPDTSISLRSAPGGSALTMLPKGVPLRVVEVLGQWTLVEAPGGFQGYVPTLNLQKAA